MSLEGTERFSIGEVARMFRVSVSTLRHYEKIGLLAPEYVDPATGYRSYSTRQFECLNTIRYLRALEMPLEQIRDFLQDREVGKIQGMLLQQRQAVIQKRQALGIVQRKIENRLRQIQDALEGPLEEVRLVELPASRGSEDYAEVSLRVPSGFFWLGMGNEAEGYPYSVHSPKADFDESAMPLGTALFFHCTKEWLKNNQ